MFCFKIHPVSLLVPQCRWTVASKIEKKIMHRLDAGR